MLDGSRRRLQCPDLASLYRLGEDALLRLPEVDPCIISAARLLGRAPVAPTRTRPYPPFGTLSAELQAHYRLLEDLFLSESQQLRVALHAAYFSSLTLLALEEDGQEEEGSDLTFLTQAMRQIQHLDRHAIQAAASSMMGAVQGMRRLWLSTIQWRGDCQASLLALPFKLGGTLFPGAQQILKSLNIRSVSAHDLNLGKLIQLTDPNKKYRHGVPQLKISLDVLGSHGCVCVDQLKADILKPDEISDVEAVTEDRKYLYVKIKTTKFNQHVVKSVQNDRDSYGYTADGEVASSPHHVLVEYSAPNIAKPFHAGHLRSTLLGNFISNLYEALGHKVTRLNFLGDWGTQFGLLLTGYHRYGDSQKLKSDPLLHLFEVYVRVNQDVEREHRDGQRATFDEALHMFSRLENGEADIVSLWQDFNRISLTEYNCLYQRLGVRFSHVHAESMYHDDARALMDKLSKEKILNTDESGVGYVDITRRDGRTHRVKLHKSDGTTLYLSRDIAAAIDRFKKYKFDKIHYVVDHGQTGHFLQLQGMLDVLGHTWSHRSDPYFHVAFGQVEGMSTRRGKVVFLRDILNEARRRMLQTLQAKDTTRPDIDLNEVAEVLGISSIIIQDLREHRKNNYTFSWDRMLNFKSDSGLFLQYCHARLCSVQRSFMDVAVDMVDGKQLTDDITCRLIQHIASYPDAVQESLQTLEPCVIVHYLFRLGHLINAAYKQLPVKNQTDDIAQARLALFDISRQTLGNGLQLLGIKPLEKM